jgi:hypothetical protein
MRNEVGAVEKAHVKIDLSNEHSDSERRSNVVPTGVTQRLRGNGHPPLRACRNLVVLSLASPTALSPSVAQCRLRREVSLEKADWLK